MKRLLLSYVTLISLISYGQTNGDNMARAGAGGRISPGRVLDIGESAEMETPFFKDNWMNATLVFSNGKSQAGLLVKLDLFENNIHYLDDAGMENINMTAVKEVLLNDSATNKEYRFIHSSAIVATGVERGWYELLSGGNTSLYKRTVKKLVGVGSLKTEEDIKPLSTTIQFHVLTNNKLLQIKRVKDIPEVLSDKKTELQAFIRSQKLGGKSENDMIRLIEHYNVLK